MTLNVLDKKNGPRARPPVEVVIDSGAADPVAPPGTFVGKVVPSAMSKNGRKYRGFDGGRIPPQGQFDVKFQSEDGASVWNDVADRRCREAFGSCVALDSRLERRHLRQEWGV